MISYSQSLNALVVTELIEDPTILFPMTMTSDGVLYVKNQIIETASLDGIMRCRIDGTLFIEEQLIELGYDIPIPPPSGSLTYDDLLSYTNLDILDGLNSGSNEWANVTPVARYHARIPYFRVLSSDDFLSHSAGTVLSASNNVTGGYGIWSGPYIGNLPYIRILSSDDFLSHSAGTVLSASNNVTGGYGIWSGSYIGKIPYL